MAPYGPVKSYYAGGWTTAKKEKLNSVVLPDKTRCTDCRKLMKTATSFSEKKKDVLRHAIALGQNKGVACRKCVGLQNVEMECVMCEQIKGLDGFTKAQRRNPDTARCMECVSETLDEEPINADSDADSADKAKEDSDDDDDDSNAPTNSEFYGSEKGGAPLASNAKDVLNVSTAGHSTKPSNSMASTGVSVANTSRARVPALELENWQQMSHMATGAAMNAAPGTSFIGYDAHGMAHNQVRSSSSLASDTSDDSDISDQSYATTTADNHLAKAEKASRSKFAKVAGTKGKKVQVAKYKTNNVRYDDDDDDDDDDDEADEDDDYFTI